MAAAIDVASDICAASAALSGLLLVFLGAVANSYDSFPSESQQAVVKKYAARGWLIAIGFFASLFSMVTSLLGKWLDVPCLVYAAAGALILSLLVISIGAFLTASGIR